MMYFEGDTAVSVQKGEIYSSHNSFKVIRVWTSVRCYAIPHNG